MARFERDGEFFELWLESGDVWPRLMKRRGRDESAVPEPVSLEHSFAARNQYCELQSRCLQDGWRRVCDPAREALLEPEPAPADPALGIDSDEGALVLADWLQQRGHPRGALIAVQHAKRTRPEDPALADEERRLLGDAAIGGAFVPWLVTEGARLSLDWERGFIWRARLDGSFDRGESEDLVWELLRHPSCRFLRELELGCHHGGDQSNALVADLIVRAGPTPPLRRLVLADFDDSEVDQIDISRAPIGDLSGLGERYPLLEDVVLKGTGDVVLGELALPHARRFALRTSSLTRAALASIIAAPWPALEDRGVVRRARGALRRRVQRVRRRRVTRTRAATPARPSAHERGLHRRGGPARDRVADRGPARSPRLLARHAQ